MDITTPALVLREVNYKEADKILTVLTPDWGKLTVSARGCRRKNSKFSAAAQQLVYSEMTLYQYQNRWSIREASTSRIFWGLERDVEKLALAVYFAEVTETVTQEELPARETLRLILNSLHALDRLELPLMQIKAAFQWKLLALSGYEPLLEGCAVCGEEPKEALFHLREGVLCCKHCRERLGEGIALPLSAAALSALRYILGGNPRRIFSFRLDERSLRQLDSAGEAFLLTQLERGFRTLDFYKTLR